MKSKIYFSIVALISCIFVSCSDEVRQESAFEKEVSKINALYDYFGFAIEEYQPTKEQLQGTWKLEKVIKYSNSSAYKPSLIPTDKLTFKVGEYRVQTDTYWPSIYYVSDQKRDSVNKEVDHVELWEKSNKIYRMVMEKDFYNSAGYLKTYIQINQYPAFKDGKLYLNGNFFDGTNEGQLDTYYSVFEKIQ